MPHGLRTLVPVLTGAMACVHRPPTAPKPGYLPSSDVHAVPMCGTSRGVAFAMRTLPRPLPLPPAPCQNSVPTLTMCPLSYPDPRKSDSLALKRGSMAGSG